MERTHDTVGSWIIVRKSDGKAIVEIFDKSKLKKLNTSSYEAIPIQEYLGSLNKKRENPMSRFIPEHPPKGSAEAYAWAEKMRAARQKKARLKHQIRQAGLKVEQEFFGPGGPLAPKATRKHSLNPGAKWHQGEEDVAYRYKKDAKDQLEKAFFAGVEAAHKTSGSAARKMGMNPSNPITHAQALAYAKQLVKHEQESAKKKRVKKNPIAVFNPPKVAGTIYNNAIEIKAQKTGGPLKGHYKHIFDSKKVKILGLTDGTVLLQHTEGKPLWITEKDYERSGRKH